MAGAVKNARYLRHTTQKEFQKYTCPRATATGVWTSRWRPARCRKKKWRGNRKIGACRKQQHFLRQRPMRNSNTKKGKSRKKMPMRCREIGSLRKLILATAALPPSLLFFSFFRRVMCGWGRVSEKLPLAYMKTYHLHRWGGGLPGELPPSKYVALSPRASSDASFIWTIAQKKKKRLHKWHSSDKKMK